MVDNFIIAAAQINPVKGDIEENLLEHVAFVEAAAAQDANLIVFPELSLTGYEPELAAALAISTDGERLDSLREMSNRHDITVIAGAPVTNPKGKPFIGSIIFSSDNRQIYLKQHLHPGEEKYFSSGDKAGTLIVNGVTVGLAICADISVGSHAETAAKGGASIYAASVFITPEGYAKDAELMQTYASRHRMVTAMANFCGSSGGMAAAGRSAVWDNNGRVVTEGHELDQQLIIAKYSSQTWSGTVITI